MALSNIFREPRREITETLIGIAVAGMLLILDYYMATAYPIPIIDSSYIERVGISMFAYPVMLGIALAGILLAAAGVHALGESICDSLQAAGVHLRPKKRYN